MMKPIDFYYWPTPNGWKISIMLEELNLPYNLHKINIGKGDQFEKSFLEISPNNKMPAITDYEGPEGEAINIFESGAILQYLARKTNKFYGENERERTHIDQWLMWQMGGFGPMLGQNHHFSQYAPEKIPYAIKRYEDETHRLYGVLNKQLENKDFMVERYSIADIATIGWATLWEKQGMNMDEFPNVAKWIERLKQRPAVVKGLNLGKEDRKTMSDEDKKILFNQRAQ